MAEEQKDELSKKIDEITKKIDIKIESRLDKIAKKNNFSYRTIKHLQILQRYYDVDLQNRVVTIPFHFANVSEICDVNASSPTRPMIKREFLSKISNYAHTIPKEFKVRFNLLIDDYQGYEHSAIIKSLIDAFEFFHYDIERREVKSSLKFAFLVSVGIILFAWYYFMFYLIDKSSWTPTEYMSNTIDKIITTVATVFIWESVYVAFIYDNSYNNISAKIVDRIRCINLVDAKGNKLFNLKREDIAKSWNVASKPVGIARTILLLSGAAFFCISGCTIVDIIQVCINIHAKPALSIALILNIIVVALDFILGISSLSYYQDKGSLKQLLMPLSIANCGVSFISLIISIIFAVLHHDSYSWNYLAICIFAIIISILFLIAVIILKNNDFKHKKETIESTRQELISSTK